MWQKILSIKVAIWLIAISLVLMFLAIIISYEALFDRVGDYNDCTTTSTYCDHLLNQHSAWLSIAEWVIYLSSGLAIIGLAILIYVLVLNFSQKRLKRRSTSGESSRDLKNTVTRLVAYIVAFIFGGSLVASASLRLIPILFSSVDQSKYGRIFSIIIIIFYPLVGGLAVYFTHKWLNKKLK